MNKEKLREAVLGAAVHPIHASRTAGRRFGRRSEDGGEEWRAAVQFARELCVGGAHGGAAHGACPLPETTRRSIRRWRGKQARGQEFSFSKCCNTWARLGVRAGQGSLVHKASCSGALAVEQSSTTNAAAPLARPPQPPAPTRKCGHRAGAAARATRLGRRTKRCQPPSSPQRWACRHTPAPPPAAPPAPPAQSAQVTAAP